MSTTFIPMQQGSLGILQGYSIQEAILWQSIQRRKQYKTQD